MKGRNIITPLLCRDEIKLRLIGRLGVIFTCRDQLSPDFFIIMQGLEYGEGAEMTLLCQTLVK